MNVETWGPLAIVLIVLVLSAILSRAFPDPEN